MWVLNRNFLIKCIDCVLKAIQSHSNSMLDNAHNCITTSSDHSLPELIMKKGKKKKR